MEPRTAVIGTTFIDCKGFARHQYNPLGRNLGSIKFVHGGVGRNVAENLANLKVPAYFVSSVDRSALGSEVTARLERAGAHLDFVIWAEEKGMGMWLALLDNNGELVGSISQMPDLQLLEKLVMEKGPELCNTVSHIVLEVDLNEKIARTVVELAWKQGKPVYGLPANLDVILNHQDLLRYMQCFICNHIEAGQLMGEDLTGMDPEVVLGLLKEYAAGHELASIVVTLGERGSVYYDARHRLQGHQPAFPTRVVDSSGAGDAFFSGTVMGLMRNRPLNEAVVYGTKVASWTIQQEENICPGITAWLKEDILFRALWPSAAGSINKTSG